MNATPITLDLDDELPVAKMDMSVRRVDSTPVLPLNSLMVTPGSKAEIILERELAKLEEIERQYKALKLEHEELEADHQTVCEHNEAMDTTIARQTAEISDLLVHRSSTVSKQTQSLRTKVQQAAADFKSFRDSTAASLAQLQQQFMAAMLATVALIPPSAASTARILCVLTGSDGAPALTVDPASVALGKGGLRVVASAEARGRLQEVKYGPYDEVIISESLDMTPTVASVLPAMTHGRPATVVLVGTSVGALKQSAVNAIHVAGEILPTIRKNLFVVRSCFIADGGYRETIERPASRMDSICQAIPEHATHALFQLGTVADSARPADPSQTPLLSILLLTPGPFTAKLSADTSSSLARVVRSLAHGRPAAGLCDTEFSRRLDGCVDGSVMALVLVGDRCGAGVEATCRVLEFGQALTFA
ncbi:hypothetical protein J8273_1367 [Carpediemonas membranifera]|uniref:Uncharacterized protein n=1 Tax=Carpediemonas membranifera TaxID=201153 RepID=A0A8J6E4J3_9EUKA|nr:hypothetical protein J8273_1367 [Carpediemonas membranifera]|eukprot:KAG9397016.1 hypothetical protein J8273_1367 [Carpediemonas membranifera]